MSQHKRGSSFHLLQLTRRERSEFSEILNRLINLPDVCVNKTDWWRPDVIHDPSEARTETIPDTVLSSAHKSAIRTWWLKHPQGANTPNWDFISSVTVKGKKGLLLIEAKAHKKEASCDGKLLKGNASERSKENHEHIRNAVEEANRYLKKMHPDFSIACDTHYQLANRIAYAWKFARLGIPVILMYLGFLRDTKMRDVGEPFDNDRDWQEFMSKYLKGVFPLELLEKEIDCGLNSFRFLIRSTEIPDKE